MSIELKVKSKHLSVEAQIIRFEEQKLRKQIKWLRDNQGPKNPKLESDWFSLNSHRRNDVRNENRSTFLARAYIAGKPYNTVEASRKVEREYNFRFVVLPRVVKLVNKYSDKKVTIEQIVEWSTLNK